MLFNEKIKLGCIKLPPQNHNKKAYQRLRRIIKSGEYIKLLETKNQDLFETLVNYNNFCTHENLVAIILKKQFRSK